VIQNQVPDRDVEQTEADDDQTGDNEEPPQIGAADPV